MNLQPLLNIPTILLETRYPEQIIDLSKDISNDMAKVYIEKSEEILNWLKTKIV